MTSEQNKPAVLGPVELEIRPGAEALPLPEARKPDEYGAGWFTAGQMRAYAADAVAAERKRWRAAAVPALAWMEGAWSRIDGEWGPSGKTLDQECADGDEPEIAALRSLLRA